jgi:hypothetical protein
LLGAPVHGFGIVGCGGATGWPWARRDRNCLWSFAIRARIRSLAALSGFGVLALAHVNGHSSAGSELA